MKTITLNKLEQILHHKPPTETCWSLQNSVRELEGVLTTLGIRVDRDEYFVFSDIANTLNDIHNTQWQGSVAIILINTPNAMDWYVLAFVIRGSSLDKEGV